LEGEAGQKREGEELTERDDGLKIVTLGRVEFIHIPGEEFFMGDVFGNGLNIEKPVHRVQLDGLYLGRYPVTFEQYDAFCNAAGHEKPFDHGWGRDRRPVINVSWKDAQAYCLWLSTETGNAIRLPTEAEWEFAARDCGNRMVWSGTCDEDKLQEYAWFNENSSQMTQPVGSKKPNTLGLYDMSGNVWEWCADLFHPDYYKISAYLNPQGPPTGEGHVLRGGSYGSNKSSLRCSCRFRAFPGGRYIYSGFRCAWTPS